MCAEDVIMPFADEPEMEQVEVIINGWQRPELPARLGHLALNIGEGSMVGSAHLAREDLAEMRSLRPKACFGQAIRWWVALC